MQVQYRPEVMLQLRAVDTRVANFRPAILWYVCANQLTACSHNTQAPLGGCSSNCVPSHMIYSSRASCQLSCGLDLSTREGL